MSHSSGGQKLKKSKNKSGGPLIGLSAYPQTSDPKETVTLI